MPKVSEILPWLDAHGVVLTAVVAVLVAAWKAIPAKTREALERAFPRVAGVVRFVVSVGPDVLGALRIGWYQVLQGVPRASVGGAPLPLAPEQRATVEAAVTPYAPPRPVEPDTARHRRAVETTQTMQGVGPEVGDRGVRGFVAPEVLVALCFGLATALAFPWGHLAALAGAVVSVLALALFAHVLPRRRTYARRGKRWLRLTMGLAPLAFAVALGACKPKYTRAPCGTNGAYACLRDQPHRCIGSTTTGWMPIGDEPCSASGQHCELRDGEPLCVAGLAADGGAQ